MNRPSEERRRSLRAAAKYKLRAEHDKLARRQYWYQRDAWMLAGLRSMCCEHGKSNDWIDTRFIALAERRPACVLYGRSLAREAH